MNIKKIYREILRLPINWRMRKKLKNRTASIIASNCVGGIISHELGIRFNSPTINLCMKPGDYLKFLANLDFYLAQDFTECHIDGVSYPVGKLVDIYVYFVHYDTFEEAVSKWKERCARIDKENLFVMMVQRDGCTEDDIRAFQKLPYKNKVVFTAKEMKECTYAYYIPGTASKNGDVINLCDYQGKFTGKRWIDEFDYVNFLNG